MRRLLPYVLFLILVCIFLWRPIFSGVALLPGDYLAQMSPWKDVIKPVNPPPQWNPLQWDAIAQFYPWRVFYARSMHAEHIPLWNPYQFCGTPFLANGQSAVLYPLNLVFLIFSPITACTVYAALHLFFAAAFMYMLLRALGCREFGGIVGGITFAFSAFMVLWLELPTFVGAAVWLPLVLLLIHKAVDQRSIFYGMLSGAVCALSFLAGHLQIAFYVALAAILWWLWKLIEVWRADGKIDATIKVVVPFIAFAVMVGLIAAPQVLPTLELAINSHRASHPTPEGYNWFIGNSLGLHRLIAAFAPDFYGNPSRNNYYLLGRHGSHVDSAADYMEFGLYAGILPLMLAIIGIGFIRKQRYIGFFMLLSGLALLTAIGTPINYLFYYLIPGFSSFGGPNRILLLYLFGIGALAGFAAQYIAEHGADKVRSWRGKQVGAAEMPMCWASIILLTLYMVSRGIAVSSFGMSAELSSAALDRVDMTFMALLVVSIMPIAVRAKARVSRDLFSILVIAIVLADLFASGINYNPTCECSKVYPDTPLTKKLQSIAKNSRIAPINQSWSMFQTPDAILPPNSAMVYGLYDVQGYDSLYTRAYKNLSSEVQGEDSSPIENGNMVFMKKITPEISKLARYVVSKQKLDLKYLKPAGHTTGAYVYRLINSQIINQKSQMNFYSFRLGLFLMLVGVGALSMVGVYRVMKYNHRT